MKRKHLLSLTGIGLLSLSSALAATNPGGSSLQVIQTYNPATLAAGQQGSYTLTVRSAFTPGLNTLAVSVPTIGGAVNPVVSNNTCGGTAAVTSTGFSLSGGTLAANGTCQITVNFTATNAGGNYTTTIGPGTATASTATDTYTVTQSASDTLSVTQLKPLPYPPTLSSLYNIGRQQTIFAEQQQQNLTYRITVGNTNSDHMDINYKTDAIFPQGTENIAISSIQCGRFNNQNPQDPAVPAFTAGLTLTGNTLQGNWFAPPGTLSDPQLCTVTLTGTYNGTAPVGTVTTTGTATSSRNTQTSTTQTTLTLEPSIPAETIKYYQSSNFNMRTKTIPLNQSSFNSAKRTELNPGAAQLVPITNTTTQTQLRFALYNLNPSTSNYVISDPSIFPSWVSVAPENITENCQNSFSNLQVSGSSLNAAITVQPFESCEIVINGFFDATTASIPFNQINTANITINGTSSTRQAKIYYSRPLDVFEKEISRSGSEIGVLSEALNDVRLNITANRGGITNFSFTDKFNPLDNGEPVNWTTVTSNTCGGTATITDGALVYSGGQLSAGQSCTITGKFFITNFNNPTLSRTIINPENVVRYTQNGKTASVYGFSKNSSLITQGNRLVFKDSPYPNSPESYTDNVTSITNDMKVGERKLLYIDQRNGTGVPQTVQSNIILSDNLLLDTSRSITTTCGGTITQGSLVQTVTVPPNVPTPNRLNYSGQCFVAYPVVAVAPGKATVQDASVMNPIHGAVTRLATPLNLNIMAVDRQITKQYSRQDVSSAEPFEVLVSLRDPSSIVQPNGTFTVRDDLPNGMYAVVPTGATRTPTGWRVNKGTYQYTISRDLKTIVWSGNFAQTSSVSALISAVGPNDLVNTIPPENVTFSDGSRVPQSASASLKVLTYVELNKSFAQNSISLNNPVTEMTLYINNSVAADNVLNVTDLMPEGMTLQSTTPVRGNCQVGQVTTTTEGTRQRLTLSGIPLGPQAFCSVTYNVQVNKEGTYTNRIEPGELTSLYGQNLLPAAATLNVSGVAPAQTRVVKEQQSCKADGTCTPYTQQPTELQGCDLQRYRVTANISGNANTASVWMSDPLDPNLTVTAANAKLFASNSSFVPRIPGALNLLYRVNNGTWTTQPDLSSRPSQIDVAVDSDGNGTFTPGTDFQPSLSDPLRGTFILELTLEGRLNGCQ